MKAEKQQARRYGAGSDRAPENSGQLPATQEHRWLAEVQDDIGSWRRWGPYVSDRSWATVREDYSPDGDAWNFLPHDLARSKAYRWGEDGIAGICDRFQILVFAPAFWNGRDPILKERLFGLTPAEANNRGPEPAPLHILPQLWFRNLWAWDGKPAPEPVIQPGPEGRSHVSLAADSRKLFFPSHIPVHYELGVRTLYAPRGGELLFT